MAEDEATPAPLPPPPPPPLLPSIPDEWPCALRQNSTAGRYVVAKQALQPGATVLTDRPYAAVVADAHRGYVCSRCLHVSSARVYQCGGCGEQARYCSEACMRQDAEAVHGQGECRALVGLARLGVDGDSQPMRLAVRIAVANAVRERRQQEDAAASSSPSPFHTPAFVRGLDHHFDEASPPVQQGVLAVARALAGLLRPAGVAATASELARFILAIQCNAHAIRNADGHVLGLGLFPLASMLNHSCRPTAHHTFTLRKGEPPALVFQTLGNVGPGQELCYSYTDLLHPTPQRRAKLAAAYFFRCRCGRCAAWEGGAGEGGGNVRVATDRLIERALASAACLAVDGCPGVLVPVGPAGGGEAEEAVDDDDDDDRPLRCSACGGEEAAADARGRLAVGTALLEARLRALQEEEAEQKEDRDGDGDGDGHLLPPAVRTLAEILLGRDETEEEGGDGRSAELMQLGLHPQHWLVTQALLALGRRLAALSVGDGAGDGGVLPPLWAVVEAWALQNLWLVGTVMNGTASAARGGVGRFPEVGQRLQGCAKALRLLGGDEAAADAAAVVLLGLGEEGLAGERGGGEHHRLLPPRARASLQQQAFADRLSAIRVAKLGGVGRGWAGLKGWT